MNANFKVAGRSGFALPMALLALGGLVLLVVALLAAARLEVRGARAYSDGLRAELAVESGLGEFEAQLAGFLERPEVGGAGFTTWGYFPDPAEESYAVALSAGRPENDEVLWLTDSNTIWLGTVGDPDEVRAAAGSAAVVDLNAGEELARGWGPMRTRWRTVASEAGGYVYRYAVWVDDESSRIDLAQAGGQVRGSGTSVAELAVPGLAGPLDAGQRLAQPHWATPACARLTLGAQFPDGLEFFLTRENRGYDVIAHLAAAAPPAGAGPHPARGTRKLNLNWNGHVDPAVSAEARVAALGGWIEAAAPEFFIHGAPGFWEGAGTAAPNAANPLGGSPATVPLRRQQVLTIAASLIDFLDADSIPTQPAKLAALDAGNPLPGAAGVLLMQEVGRPEFFGADRCARINEVQILWNSRGAADGYLANPEVVRTALPDGSWEYQIPVTWRIELWNMDRQPIPAQAYAVRVFFSQQIDSFTFGAAGSPPVPEETELVLDLNSGNPVALGPNEVRVFDLTRTFTRRSTEDRGTTWAAFRLGGLGTLDDQPNGHTRQAMALLAADIGAWLSATTYQQLTQAPVDGVCSVGIGNKGDLKGNKINDPRIIPLRCYTPATLSPTAHNPERDANSNKPGRLGWVNNLTGSEAFNFQDFTHWRDRPRFASPIEPEEGVTHVGNRGFTSVGELGQIFDPGWVHPRGRGGGALGGFAYHAGLASPFRGGGSIAAGQPERRASLAASSWTLLDGFGVAAGDAQLAPEEWRGRINVNVPKRVGAGDGRVFDNLVWVLHLPSLDERALNAPADFSPATLAAGIRKRLTRGGQLFGTQTISGWRDARPFTSVGHLSELEAWTDPNLFVPVEAPGDGIVAGFNRSDAGREEIFRRSAGLLTTRSHSYRVFVRGEVLRAGVVVARCAREVAIRFECSFDPNTGELRKVTPRRLRTMVR